MADLRIKGLPDPTDPLWPIAWGAIADVLPETAEIAVGRDCGYAVREKRPVNGSRPTTWLWVRRTKTGLTIQVVEIETNAATPAGSGVDNG